MYRQKPVSVFLWCLKHPRLSKPAISAPLRYNDTTRNLQHEADTHLQQGQKVWHHKSPVVKGWIFENVHALVPYSFNSSMRLKCHGIYKFFPRGLRRKDQGGHDSIVQLWSSSSSCQASRCVWGHWPSQCQLECLLSIKQMRTYQTLDVLKIIDILQLFTDIFKLVFEVAETKKKIITVKPNAK